MRTLETVAESILCSTPQEIEAEFCRAASAATRLADRRNEIAHGIVRPLQWMQSVLAEYEELRERPLEYALVPPLFTRRNLDERHRPKYVYTANELMQFGLAFNDLSREVALLKTRIVRILQETVPLSTRFPLFPQAW
jgi:hypothetical protein